MNTAQQIDKIKASLKTLTDKKNVLFVKRGNSAVEETMKLAKVLDRDKVLIQDQGGWITYKQFANKNGIMCIPLKTDYGITDLADLEKKASGKSVFIVNSLSGYYASENISAISKICQKKHCLLINDVSGSIGTKLAKYGDIVIGSFNQWKPINVDAGGFVSYNDKIPDNFEMDSKTHKLIQKYFDMNIYFKDFIEFEFKDRDLVKLFNKVKNVYARQKFFYKKHWQIKRDLKKFQIIHPKSSGINVIIKYDKDSEKGKIIKYCDDNKIDYTECPRYIRVNEQAISIEVKRL